MKQAPPHPISPPGTVPTDLCHWVIIRMVEMMVVVFIRMVEMMAVMIFMMVEMVAGSDDFHDGGDGGDGGGGNHQDDSGGDFHDGRDDGGEPVWWEGGHQMHHI